MTWTSNPMISSSNEPTPYIDFNTARILANIAHRAKTLFQDGYTMQPSVLSGLFFVTSPEGNEYTVTCAPNLGDFGKDCDCPAYKQWGTCKHYLAIELKVKEDEQADLEWERAEEARNFFDSAREYDL